MKFFHVYNEDCFKGLEKNGLLNKDSGFKIQNVFSVPVERQFNNIAAKGGKLHNMIKEGRFPFYVDRIAGGITYFPYQFDQELIREYDELLGDWFLGFQLHESGSNRRASDWQRILKLTGEKGPYDPALLRKILVRDSSRTPAGMVLQALSQDHSDVYAKLRYAQTVEEYLEEMRDLFSRRMAEVDGHILPCDSYYLATKIQDELGMKTFMPEVGCQIMLMRLEVALARGMAKASHKTWGTYYECWRADPEVKPSGYCMPCYNLDPINEWYLTQETHQDDFTTYGENGGSSRLLQNRIYYYTLMSGADYMSEEWGLNCSYTDMQDFTLSAYGETKKAFIHDAENYQGVQAVIPFAIVLPKAYSSVELSHELSCYELGNHRSEYMLTPLNQKEQAYFGHIEDVLKLFFARYGETYGNEGHVITNSRFGDVADIIYEDASEEALKQYEYLIDASKDGSFARAKAGSGLRILESTDLEKLAVTVERLIPVVMPVSVNGLSWLVSVDDRNRSFLSIFNNEGNERSIYKGDTIMTEADRTVTVTFKNPANLKVVREGSRAVSIRKVDNCTYYVEVPATSFVILEY
jgi:hypothetical protein